MTDADSDDLLTPRERIALKRASLRHLLDLKRAGHSPRFCELVVDRRDRVVALPASSRGRKPGGANNPHGIGGKSGKSAEGDIVNVDNIHVDNIERPTGTSVAAFVGARP